MPFIRLAILLVVPLVCGCSDNEEEQSPSAGSSEELGVAVDPPFAVEGNAADLLLVWFDEEGPHTATSRDEIPEAHRDRVRVDSLSLSPEDRPDPGSVFLADLRSPGQGGSYPVRRVERETFEELIEAAQASAEPTAVAGGDVVIYGADWCNACRSTASYLTSRNVPFVERNIERDAGARQEMQQKVSRAGLSATGIPVIDFRGTILTGFNPQRLDRLIRSGS